MSADGQAAIYRGPRTDEYETPGWVFDPLNEQYQFTWDLAATPKNTKAPLHFSEMNPWFTTGTDRIWPGVAWLNPPFSKAERFFAELVRCHHGQVVAIYKLGNMETAVWRTIFASCSWIAIPHRRVQYLLNGKPVRATTGKRAGKISSAQFASAVIGFNVPRPAGPNMWPHTILEVPR